MPQNSQKGNTPSQLALSSPNGSKGNILLLVLLGVLLLGAVGVGAYYLGRSSVPPSTTRTTQSIPTPTTDETTNWKMYKLDGVSFQYPSTWQILDDVPEEYKAREAGQPGWLETKMFYRECSGPVLQNSQEKSTIIVIEILKLGFDGDFCWSTGDFSNTYKRTITALDPPVSIDVTKWRRIEYYNKQTQRIETPTWKGDLFQQWHATAKGPNGERYVVALLYREGKDTSAEQVFDQLLASFKSIR